MTRPMLLLARLNDTDLAVDATKARLAEIARALREPAALAATRQDLAAAEAELERCRTAQKALELAQKDAAGKLTRAEQRLYGGQVRNPRELEDAEKDVRQLRSQQGHVEDQLLEALIAAETATERYNALRDQMARQSADWAAQQGALRDEQAQLQRRLTTEQARQVAARKAVPAELLQVYDALRPRRAGRAVAELDGDECSACRVVAPPSKVAAARDSDELIYCGNCGRLLWTE